MDLLDIWKSPEPSAQFDGRLRARLHEPKSHATTWWWPRLSQPLLAAGMVTLLFAGVVAVRHARHSFIEAANRQELVIEPVAASAVEDLQSLEEVDDTAGDSELLDLIATDQTAPADRSNAAAH